MRVEGAATSISWIPSEAVTGAVYKVPFGVKVSHYDDPPPDRLPDVTEYLAGDSARFANVLRAWVEVRDGEIVDYGHRGSGQIGSTTLRLGGLGLTFAAVALDDIRVAEQLDATTVRFTQTAGGRTGVPAPRRVDYAPFVQFFAPLAWSTLALTLTADGGQHVELAGASPFPRHWLYDADGALIAKSAAISYHDWSTQAFGSHTPWGAADSPALTTAVETALERELSLQIMRGERKPRIARLAAGQVLTEQGDAGDELYLLLDGMLKVSVDGDDVAEVGPGAVLGERAILESGRRTSTLSAVTRCTVAVADRDAIELTNLQRLAEGHHREDG